MAATDVIAIISGRGPGKEAALHAVLTGLLTLTRKESGCLNYDLHQSPDNPVKFLYSTKTGRARRT